MKSEKSENNEQISSLGQQLLEAITASRTLKANQLIHAGANVDFIDDTGRTLLHIALQKGLIYVAKRLIDAGAKTNIVSVQNDKKTAGEMLYEMFRNHVVSNSEIEATKSKQIFALAKQVLGLNYVDAEGQTFLSYTIRHGQFALTKELIDEGAEKIPLPDGTTIDELINDTLNKAIMADKIIEIIPLIDIAINLDHIDKDGWTCLHLALKQHKITLAFELIQRGASKEIVSKNDEAITPIDLASLALSTIKDPAMVSILQFMGANVNNINNEGWTPLHLALISGNTELAVELFNMGAKPVQSQNSSKQTPADIINEQTLLHKFILSPASSINVLSGLVRIGANINLIDENGWSPLHLALKENKVELAKVLIQNGADKEIVSKNDVAITPLTQLNAMLCKAIGENNSIVQITKLIELGANVNDVNQDGFPLLHIALRQENIEIANLLIRNGANKDAISQNNEKKTTADIINDKDYLNKLILENIGTSINKLKILIKAGLDVNHIDSCGWSPLCLALKKENLGVAKLLLKAGANRDQISTNLMNELLCKFILESPSRSEITELIDMGADVNCFNHDGLTPLHLALKKGSIARVKLLLKHGANMNIASKNNEIKTPADIASELQLNLFSGVDNNVSDNKPKESLILFRGPDIEHFQTYTSNPKHNLFHSFSLGQYFNLQEFNDFYVMLEAIQLLASTGSKINLVIDAHGMQTTPYTIKTIHGPDQNACDILDSIIKAAGGKPVKLLTTCCFGERLHSCDSELGSKMPNGSMIITLSKQDRTTQATDYCHKNIPHILDVLFNSDGGNYLKLEHLLEAYCLSQRFNKNTPKVSLFNGSTQKIVSLKDYFNNNILKVNDLEISKTMSDLLNIMGLSKDDLDIMLREISSNSNIKTQESLWRIPSSLSDIQNISQYLEENDKYGELLELYKGYFINNNAIKTLPSKEVTKSAYSFHKARDFGGAYPHTDKHGSPLLACMRKISSNFDEIDATPKHSILLAVAADHLIAEIGSGNFFNEWELS